MSPVMLLRLLPFREQKGPVGFAPAIHSLTIWPLSAGEIRRVKGTPFDLTTPVLIGPRLKEVPGPGFDHNFCLSFPGDSWTERDAARFAAKDTLTHTTHTHLSLMKSIAGILLSSSQSVSPS